ncbi:MAG: ATP-binding protein [Pusillimonas sp.]
MQTIASLSLVNGPDTVTRALAWLESLAGQQQWPSHMGFKLGLCLDEALTNIVLYGFQGKDKDAADNRIDIAVLQEGSTLVLDISDNGLPFDPTRKQVSSLATSLEDAEIGGHGLRLMRHYLQDIQYRRTAQHNHLRLVAALDSNDR